jgi:UDP-N-acetylmuramyl pentapeptide phosphotransferase/UDP-N-acetylglucosamine-1-phosphate transferase
MSFVLGPWFIRQLQVAADRPNGRARRRPRKSHLSKAGTPTMGGALIILCLVDARAVLWSDLYNPLVWLTLSSITVAYAAIGFLDDSLKLRLEEQQGPARQAEDGSASSPRRRSRWASPSTARPSNPQVRYRLALPFRQLSTATR